MSAFDSGWSRLPVTPMTRGEARGGMPNDGKGTSDLPDLLALARPSGAGPAGTCRWCGLSVAVRETADGAELPASRRLELHHQLGRYPAAPLNIDTLGPRPLPHLGRVRPARSPPPHTTRRPPRHRALPARRHVRPQHLPQRRAVLRVQVNLELIPVQREPDSSLGLTAVDIVHERRHDLLRHVGTSFP